MQPREPELGSTIDGKYRVDGVLGRGGMGLVLAATHRDLDRSVAIKLVRSDCTRSADLLARLHDEARAVAALQSEHVCRLLDFGRTESGQRYIVYERLSGVDLEQLVAERGPLPVSEAVDLVLQACAGLAEAHAHRIVHRDLKPENLFLAHRRTGPDIVKVLDFGIAKNVGLSPRHASTDPRCAIGSPSYMAPEQLAHGSIDQRVDIWGLGAVLYELLTGCMAFDAPSVAEVKRAVLSGRARSARALRPDLPSDLDLVIQRCLRTEPEQRFGDVAELSRALAPHGSARAEACATEILHTLRAERVPEATPSLLPAVRELREASTFPASTASGRVAHSAWWLVLLSAPLAGVALFVASQTSEHKLFSRLPGPAAVTGLRRAQSEPTLRAPPVRAAPTPRARALSRAPAPREPETVAEVRAPDRITRVNPYRSADAGVP